MILIMLFCNSDMCSLNPFLPTRALSLRPDLCLPGVSALARNKPGSSYLELVAWEDLAKGVENPVITGSPRGRQTGWLEAAGMATAGWTATLSELLAGSPVEDWVAEVGRLVGLTNN